MHRLSSAKTIVAKVGTSTLTTPEGRIDERYISRLAEQLVEARGTKRNIVLVTSGAIRAGVAAMRLKQLNSSRQLAVPEKQAAAAVGQGLLMHTYNQAFARHHQPVAQVLLTRDDLESRERFLNARNTLHTLFEMGVIPIVNENDTVAVEEIKFGDNDALAALVAILVEADLLLLLSNVEGFYLSEVDEQKGLPDRKPLARIDRITPEIQSSIRKVISPGGTGGMYSKLEAAKKVTASGISMVIADGRLPNVIPRILAGEHTGTLFPAGREAADRGRLSSRKRWIAFGRKPKGEIIINEGAMRSIVERGKSLLPVGICEVRGSFESGDMVSLTEPVFGEFARGLVNYCSEDLRKIAGLKTNQIEKVLGDRYFDEVVHRDNLVKTGWTGESMP